MAEKTKDKKSNQWWIRISGDELQSKVYNQQEIDSILLTFGIDGHSAQLDRETSEILLLHAPAQEDTDLDAIVAALSTYAPIESEEEATEKRRDDQKDQDFDRRMLKLFIRALRNNQQFKDAIKTELGLT